MAITDKKTGVWGLDQVYNKINQGSIWTNNRSGLLMAWGNFWGRTPTYLFSSPTQVPGTTWVKARGGGNSTLAIQTDGSLWSWGTGGNGRLGQNSVADSPYPPVQVGTDTTWDKISMGSGFGSSIKTDGTLWVWGKNEGGQLGQNEQHGDNGHSSPVQIPGTTWSHLICDGYAMMATKTDNTLWAWGRNASGELGHNNRNWYSSPVQIPGTSWSGPLGNCNKSFFCIRTDGTLWSWGENQYGKLGINDGTEYSSPKQIPGTNWSNFGAGGGGNWQMRALKTDGTLWTWGRNNDGQLGLTDRVDRSSPTQIPGTWTTFGAAQYSCAGIKTGGTLWIWGGNDYGQLAQNDTAYRSSPTQVPGIYSDVGAVWDVNGGAYYAVINE